MGGFCPEASKRRKLEVEVAEDGVMELCVEYNRYVLCGRRGRVCTFCSCNDNLSIFSVLLLSAASKYGTKFQSSLQARNTILFQSSFCFIFGLHMPPLVKSPTISPSWS